MGHMSELRTLPLYVIKAMQQVKAIDEILLKMVVQSQRCLGL